MAFLQAVSAERRQDARGIGVCAAPSAPSCSHREHPFHREPPQPLPGALGPAGTAQGPQCRPRARAADIHQPGFSTATSSRPGWGRASYCLTWLSPFGGKCWSATFTPTPRFPEPRVGSPGTRSRPPRPARSQASAAGAQAPGARPSHRPSRERKVRPGKERPGEPGTDSPHPVCAVTDPAMHTLSYEEAPFPRLSVPPNATVYTGRCTASLINEHQLK